MKKENTICPLCGKKRKHDFFGLKNYGYCEICKLAWIKKFPKAQYDDSYYKGKSGIISNLFQPLANMFYSIRESYIGGGSKKTWIDVGAGEGGFLKTVDANQKIGVEVSASGRDLMKEEGLKTLTEKQFLKSKGLKADVISYWHVLEHVENPWEYLKAGKNNLNKKGKIVIGVPNIDSFEFKFAKKYWFHLQPQFHVLHFSPTSMKKLLEKSGFRIEKIDYWSLEHHLTGVLQSFINTFSRSKENVLHKLVKRGTGKSPMKPKDLFWAGLWMTIGSPIIFMFWVVGSILKRGGTIVIVAEPKITRS